MQTASDMSKDQTFRLRLDATDKERLDVVAAHYSATASTAVRILIKEKYDAIQAAKRTVVEDFRDEHGLVLEILSAWDDQGNGDPILRESLDGPDFAKALDGCMPSHPNANFHGGLSRILNELTRWGYLRRVKGPAYMVLGKSLLAADARAK